MSIEPCLNCEGVMKVNVKINDVIFENLIHNPIFHDLKKEKQKQIIDTFATICDTLFKSDQIMLMFEDEACVRVTAKMLENSLMRSDMPLFVKKTSQKTIRRYR